MDRSILCIERQWHQAPGWFSTLPHDDRTRLLALWNIEQAELAEAARKVPGPRPR